MSSECLRKLVVLALYDDRLLDVAQKNPGRFAARFGFSTQEVQRILALDARLFRFDALRADRMLTGLLNLFCVSVWSVHRTNIFAQLKAFFSDPIFYNAVLNDEFIFKAFAAFLCREFGEARSFIELELAFETVRYPEPCPVLARDNLVRSPNVTLLKLPLGHLEAYLSHRSVIDASEQTGAGFLLQQKLPVIQAPREPEDDATECILVEYRETLTVGAIAEGLGEFLQYLQEPRSKDLAFTKLCELGAEIDECDSLLRQFLNEGLLLGQIFSP